MRNTKRFGDLKFTFKCSQGNTIIAGVPIGSVGMWVAKLGGDDLTIEELLINKKAEFNGIKFEIKEEAKNERK